MDNIIKYNNDKHHFFIGTIIDNNNDAGVLKRIQKKIVKKYKLRGYHINNKFYVNCIYIGYLDDITAHKYMNNILNNLLKELTTRIKKINCNYLEYKLNFDKLFYKISLTVKDNENNLENIIVPFLHDNAILPVYNKKRTDFNPSVELIYFKESKYIKKKEDIKIMVPIENFKLNNLSLIRGTSVKRRIGNPSLHDQMFLEVVEKYIFPLDD